MRLVITVESGAAAGSAQRALTEGTLAIGRDADNDWTLPDPSRSLSRHHCLIERRNGGFWLADKSANGTLVNDRPVTAGDRPVALNDGDMLRLGPYLLRLRIEADPGDAAAPPDGFAFDPLDRSSAGGTEPAAAGPGAAMPAKGDPLSASGVISQHWLDQEPAEQRPAPPPPAPPDEVGSDGFFEDYVPPQKEHYTVFTSVPRPVDRAMPAPDADDDEDEPAVAYDPFALEAPPGPPLEPVELPPQPVEPPQPAWTPAPAEPGPPAPAHPAAGDREQDAGSLLAAFLDGAGLADIDLAADTPEAFFRRLGANYAAMAEGMRQLLNARAAVKGEAGLEQTRVRSSGNNPLKTAVRADEAVRALVTPKGPGYLDPEAAIQAGLADLKNHEIAMLEGMQAALKALLRRFDPVSLERQLRDGSVLRALIAGGRHARYWRLFKERYGDIAQRSEQRFMGDFDKEFARAYQRRSNTP